MALELIVTNSIQLEESRKPTNTKELSVAGLIGKAIIL
jgi:ribose-phosphate pyrophosphokinase